MRLGCRMFQLFGDDWKQMFDFALDNGLQSIQIDHIREEDVPAVQEQIDKTGIAISSIGAMSWKMLGPDMEQSRTDQEQVKRKIAIAGLLKVPLVSQFAGNHPYLSFRENIRVFKTVFAPLVAFAEDHGVKLAVENCPLVEGTPPIVHNFAYAPAAWDAMFEAIPSPALGLEFDTGHPPMLGIDMQRCIREYKDKLFHVHIKDCRIHTEHQYKYGKLGPEFYSYAVPGQGDVDFSAVFAALREIGYRNDVTLDLRPTTRESIAWGAAYIQPLLNH